MSNVATMWYDPATYFGGGGPPPMYPIQPPWAGGPAQLPGRWRMPKTYDNEEGQVFVNPNMKSAAKTAAELTRAQWEWYKHRFIPLEDAALKETFYGDPGVFDREIAQGREDVNRSFDAAQGMQRRALDRMGTSYNPEQRAVQTRIDDVSRSAAIVDAANNIREKIVNRSRGLFAGSAPGTGAIGG